MLNVQRTQIYLPKKLRLQIDKYRHEVDESMAEYFRKAAKERLDRQKRKKVDLKKLAKEITSGVKKSGWEGIDVLAWQRAIRKDRKIL